MDAAPSRRIGKRWIVPGLAVLMTTLIGATPAVAVPPEGDIVGAGAPDAVKDHYIVTLKTPAVGAAAVSAAAVAQTADTLADRFDGSVRHVYAAAMKGFAVELPEREARLLAAHPSVASVEQD